MPPLISTHGSFYCGHLLTRSLHIPKIKTILKLLSLSRLCAVLRMFAATSSPLSVKLLMLSPGNCIHWCTISYTDCHLDMPEAHFPNPLVQPSALSSFVSPLAGPTQHLTPSRVPARLQHHRHQTRHTTELHQRRKHLQVPPMRFPPTCGRLPGEVHTPLQEPLHKPHSGF
jgi:hypothetical protein